MAHARSTRHVEEPYTGATAVVGAAKAHRRLLSVEHGRGSCDRRLEDVVRPVLRYGSLLSMILTGLGVALALWSSRQDSRMLQAASSPGSLSVPLPPGAMLSALAAGDPMAIITLGLLVLIATPVLRVASTVVFFLWEGDRVYLAITSFVLLVLLLGFAVGTTG